ncbi:hypothetical protein ElyMa_006858400 [Elysia marginata]|uniref:ABC transmembrane type-1 domain-containing protein n=1 Tax=Elysia marginata TaxID=1093978 RepID=A0AAV4J7S3_9GAST|nr:hypothetical protein ElyMa_006858400 [Elysia marginata]
MRPLFRVFLLETAFAILYMFGNRLMDLAFVLASIYIGPSMLFTRLENGDRASQTGAHEVDTHVEKVVVSLRPYYVFIFLLYSRQLRDVLLDRLQWIIAHCSCALVSLSRMKVLIPIQMSTLAFLNVLSGRFRYGTSGFLNLLYVSDG